MNTETLGFVRLNDHQVRTGRVNPQAWMIADERRQSHSRTAGQGTRYWPMDAIRSASALLTAPAPGLRGRMAR